MRLVDLEPRFYVLETGGPRVGMTFLCPHCLKERLGVMFHHKGHEAIEDAYIRAHHADGYVWNLDSQDSFDTMTLRPSVDASKSGHWHGYITNGAIS